MPIARFEMSDGRVARFEVPEGTTPEQAQSLIERQFPNLDSPQRSLPAEAARQTGLTVRGGVQGVANLLALPATVYDAAADVVAPGKGGRFRSGQAVSDLLTRIGLPEPENATERVVQDVTGAMAGQGGTLALGRGMANAAGPVVSRVGELLGMRPGAQVVGAAAAGGGAGGARESGAGPVGQTVAGLLGGLVAPVGVDVALQGMKAIGRGVSAATKGFTEPGRKDIVGNTLTRLASDPARAVAEMEASVPLVPGSQPTAAQASRDPGLLTAERAIRSGASGAKFAERASQQNAARNAVLNELAGDEAALNTATTAREASTTPLREGAFAAKTPIDIAPVNARIDAILASPAGKRQTVADAMTWLKDRVKGISDPEELYAIRQDVGDVLSGKLQGEKANLRLASGQLIEVRKVLDDAIERGAPGFQKYLSEYREQSKPINQMEVLQDVRGRTLNAGTDAVTGERIMSPAKFYGAVTKPAARAELAKVLTPEQLGKLDAIAADLDRGALSDTAGKAAGSNTYQNVSTAYVLGRALGGKTPDSPMWQNLLRPLAWFNKLNEPALQQLLADAMLDPALARTLMARTTPRAMESISLELWQRAKALGLGAAIGTQQEISGRSRAQ